MSEARKSGLSSVILVVNAAIPWITVVFAYRERVPCKCRDLWLLYRDCRGFRLPRKRAVQMAFFFFIYIFLGGGWIFLY